MKKFIFFAAFTLILIVSLNAQSAHSKDFSFGLKPNILFILADDLGWSDTELFGTTTFYETPNINKLAKQGMLFLQAYTPSPVCSPTRASIVTGQYFTRFGITNARCHLEETRMHPQVAEYDIETRKTIPVLEATRLDTIHYTLPKFLKDNGYVTGHFGKWHLGLPPYDASHAGFDEVQPKTPEEAITDSYLAPWESLKAEGFIGKDGEHIEDRMAQEASKFIVEHKNKPFFLNYWAFSVHSPWSAKTSLTNYYAEKKNPLNPQRNPVYAAMIHSLDDAVGTIMKTLDSLDLSKNTIIVFTSDNGGNTWAPPKTEPMGFENIPATSNYPMRNGKGWHYEGGTRVPLIYVWPNKIKANSISYEQVSAIDFYPTLIDLLGKKVPENLNFDGVSYAPVLLKNETLKERPMFGYHPVYNWGDKIPPTVWVRKGDWKLIRFFNDNEDQSDRFELNNLHNDIFESSDQNSRNSTKVKELNLLIDDFLKSTNGVYPQKNPNYKK